MPRATRLASISTSSSSSSSSFGITAIRYLVSPPSRTVQNNTFYYRDLYDPRCIEYKEDNKGRRAWIMAGIMRVLLAALPFLLLTFLRSTSLMSWRMPGSPTSIKVEFICPLNTHLSPLCNHLSPKKTSPFQNFTYPSSLPCCRSRSVVSSFQQTVRLLTTRRVRATLRPDFLVSRCRHARRTRFTRGIIGTLTRG